MLMRRSAPFGRANSMGMFYIYLYIRAISHLYG